MGIPNASVNAKLSTGLLLALLVAGVSSGVAGYHMYHIGYSDGLSEQKQLDAQTLTNLTLQGEASTVLERVPVYESNGANLLVNVTLTDECPTIREDHPLSNNDPYQGRESIKPVKMGTR